MVLKQKGGSMAENKKKSKAELEEEATRAEDIERERQQVVAHAIGAVQHNFGRTTGRVSIYKR